MDAVSLNATSGGYNMALNSVNGSSLAIIVAVVVFVTIGVVLFILIKNFRRLIYGLCTAVPIAIISSISWSIASPVKEGDWYNVIVAASLLGSILLLIGIGYIVEKLGLVKKIGDTVSGRE
jgi:predicted RND superfamily exporter protein